MALTHHLVRDFCAWGNNVLEIDKASGIVKARFLHWIEIATDRASSGLAGEQEPFQLIREKCVVGSDSSQVCISCISLYSFDIT